MASVLFRNVWAVYSGGSEKHSGKPEWFYDDEWKAKEAAKGKGWYGGTAHVEKFRAVEIDDKTYVLAGLNCAQPVLMNYGPKEIEETKERAMAKLTDKELRALGLK